MVHADAPNEIQVRKRDDSYCVEALNESEPLAKSTLANDVALSSNGSRKFVSFSFTFAKAMKVVNVETSCLCVWQL